jgi:soluble lytic murein transglycosylase
MRAADLAKVLLAALWGALLTSSAKGDIYRYVDPNGVVHFTNVPTSPKYRLYIRERRHRLIWDGGRRALRFDPLIRRTALQYGVDPLLVKAVIKVESDFDPWAVSHKGAKGLMQLMPETARHFRVRDPFDPVENVRAGVHYLKGLLALFRGELKLAIAAYNAGKEAVFQYGGVPPYAETQDYVRKVLAYYDLLRRHRTTAQGD